MNDKQRLILTGQEGIGKYRRKALPGDLAKQKATEHQWLMIDMAIKAFAAAYPEHWLIFCKMMNDLKDPSNPYSVATEGDLKKAEHRHSASFPEILNELGDAVDGLYPVLQNIIPGLTHKDSANFREFLRRYPIFSPSDKLNV